MGNKLKQIVTHVSVWILILSLCAAFFTTYLPSTAAAEGSYGVTLGVCCADTVCVRSAPSESGVKMSSVNSGELVTVLDSETGKDGHTWYFVRTDWGYQGYVQDTYLTVSEIEFSEETVSDYADFLLSLEGFPESYKSGLLYLHTLYPSWSFVPVNTGLTLSEAVVGESALGTSAVEANCLRSWKSTASGCYNWTTDKYTGVDGSNWNQASPELIAYFMDPRNFFSSSGIFQFISQSYTAAEGDADREEVLQNLRCMLSGSFMMPGGETVVEYADGETIDYAEVLYEAGKASGVSPYALAAMILVEQGTDGSKMITGDVTGYTGLYNFFNIGAYTTSSMSALERGLWYAGGGSSAADTWNRPWSSRKASIEGGAAWYGSGYIQNGQDTLYTKRFNVLPAANSKLYQHQYMSSTYAAAIEAGQDARGYSSDMRTAPFVFRIPVYTDLPEETRMPLSNASPNATLSSLKLTQATLTPTFSMFCESYSCVVDSSVSSVTVNAAANTADASVSINGTAASSASVPISVGENLITVSVTAPGGTVRSYTIHVTRKAAEFSDRYTAEGDLISGIEPGTTAGALLTHVFFPENSDVQVTAAAGEVKEAGQLIATGDRVSVTNTEGTVKEYTLIIYGDVNGDGVISNADRIKVRNHLLNEQTLAGAYLAAADVNHDGSVTNADRIKIRNHILGTGTLSQ